MLLVQYMLMKTAHIVMNGNLSKGISGLRRKKNDLIICADGGASYAKKQHIIPDVIIGDCDSISREIKSYFEKKNVQFIKYPQEKDYTDAELAIDYALKNIASELVIYGLFGDRIDHMLSNIFHISTLAKKIPCRFIEGNTEMQFIHSSAVIKGKNGDELSLIPLKGDCHGVTTEGLYYSLKNETLPFGTTRGISNVFIGLQGEVTLKEGVLFAVHRKKS